MNKYNSSMIGLYIASALFLGVIAYDVGGFIIRGKPPVVENVRLKKSKLSRITQKLDKPQFNLRDFYDNFSNYGELRYRRNQLGEEIEQEMNLKLELENLKNSSEYKNYWEENDMVTIRGILFACLTGLSLSGICHFSEKKRASKKTYKL